VSRRQAAPESADDVLDVVVRTLGREAQRIERRSQQRQLLPFELEALVKVAGAVTKVVEQQANPFGPAFTARLRRMTDGELDVAKRRLQAIETTATE
jgi:hypothetical protein